MFGLIVRRHKDGQISDTKIEKKKKNFTLTLRKIPFTRFEFLI